MPETKQRVLSLDLARGLAVLFMICIHVLDTFSAGSVKHTLGGWFIGFFGGPPSAPVFMALMGASAYYSRKQQLGQGILRGLRIIALGYVLNLLRNTLPALWAAHFMPSTLAALPRQLFDYKECFLELDILQFAGLALIAIALLRRFQVPRYLLLVLATMVALAGPVLWGKGAEIPVAGRLLDYLWGDRPAAEDCLGNLVSFPFFPWFSYVLLGMFLGETLTRSADAPRTLRRLGLAGLAICAGTLPLLLPHFLSYLGDYYHSRPGIILFHSGLVLCWLALCQLAVEKLPPNRVFELFYGWSRNVNRIYMIQWTLIMWGAVLLRFFDRASWPQTLGLMAAMALATHFINALWLQAFKPKARPAVSHQKTLTASPDETAGSKP